MVQLFARDKNGKVRQWSIDVVVADGDTKVVRRYGQVDGKSLGRSPSTRS